MDFHNDISVHFQNPENFDGLITQNQFDKAVGNANSANVAERILREAMIAARIVDRDELPDRWATTRILPRHRTWIAEPTAVS